MKPLSRHLLNTSLGTLCCAWVGFSLYFTSGLGYSFWLDELYSVTASAQSYAQLFSFLLSDVHPPLYQLALKWWMNVFGTSEPAARAMSLAAVLAGLLYFVFYARFLSEPSKWVASLLIASSPLVPYFSQEARSYGLLFGMSSVLTVLYLNRDYLEPPGLLTILLTGLVTSLVHYFGLLFTGCVFLLLLLEHLQKPHRLALIVGFGVLALVWPTVHVALGDLAGKTGGNFWIKLPPLTGTLNIAGSALAPWGRFAAAEGGLSALAGKYLVFLLLILFAVVALSKKVTRGVSSSRWGAWTESAEARAYALFVSFLALLVLIDMKTPMSTARNYIVAVPVFSVVTACIFQACSRHSPALRVVALSVVAFACAANLLGTTGRLEEKSAPAENWREVSRAALSQAGTEGSIYFHANNDGPSSKLWQELVNNHYLRLLSRGTVHAAPWNDAPLELKAHAVVFYQHLTAADQREFEAGLEQFAVIQRVCAHQGQAARGCSLALRPR